MDIAELGQQVSQGVGRPLIRKVANEREMKIINTAYLYPDSKGVEQCLRGMLARSVSCIDHWNLGNRGCSASAAFLMVPNQNEIVGILVKNANPVLEELIFGPVLLAVYPRCGTTQ